MVSGRCLEGREHGTRQYQTHLAVERGIGNESTSDATELGVHGIGHAHLGRWTIRMLIELSTVQGGSILEIRRRGEPFLGSEWIACD